MNTLFEHATRFTESHYVFGSRFNRISRKFAVIFPCFLICCAVFTGNIWAEDLNSRGMGQKIVFDERINGRSVMVPVPFGEVYSSESRSERGTEFRAGDSSRNPIAYISGGEISDQSTESSGGTGGYKRNDPIARAFRGHCILLHILASIAGCMVGGALVWWGLPLIFEGREYVPWPFNK